MKRNLCTRSDPKKFALQPTQAGDVCLLLEPLEDTEITRLQRYIKDLQTQFGGRSAHNIHITCQRFSMNRDEDMLERLVAQLKKHPILPFTVQAVALVPLYVPFENQYVLKWCIHISPELRACVRRVRGALRACGIASHYRPWFVPSLITALKGLPAVYDPLKSDTIPLAQPYPLFTIRRMELSRVIRHDDFEILAEIVL